MKMRIEQLNALLQQEQSLKKAQSNGEGFEEMFAKELQQPGSAVQGAPSPPGAQAGIIGQMLLEPAEQAASSDPVKDALQQSLQQASGMLDSLNAYANALSAGGAEGNLKEIYPLLQGLEQQMKSLKQGAAPLEGAPAELSGLINELEVLTAAEKFKFNRGDYI